IAGRARHPDIGLSRRVEHALLQHVLYLRRALLRVLHGCVPVLRASSRSGPPVARQRYRASDGVVPVCPGFEGDGTYAAHHAAGVRVDLRRRVARGLDAEGNRRMAARSWARGAVLRGAEPALPGWQGVRARRPDAECRLSSGTVLAPDA